MYYNNDRRDNNVNPIDDIMRMMKSLSPLLVNASQTRVPKQTPDWRDSDYRSNTQRQDSNTFTETIKRKAFGGEIVFDDDKVTFYKPVPGLTGKEIRVFISGGDDVRPYRLNVKGSPEDSKTGFSGEKFETFYDFNKDVRVDENNVVAKVSKGVLTVVVNLVPEKEDINVSVEDEG